MSAALQGVWLRMVTYVANPLLGLIPAALLGYVTFSPFSGDLRIETAGIWTALVSGAMLSAGVYAIFGIKPPDWALDDHLVRALLGAVSRVFTYATSFVVGAVPAGLAGLIEWNETTGVLVLHLGGVPAALGAGGALSALVYAKWGWKPKDEQKP